MDSLMFLSTAKRNELFFSVPLTNLAVHTWYWVNVWYSKIIHPQKNYQKLGHKDMRQI